MEGSEVCEGAGVRPPGTLWVLPKAADSKLSLGQLQEIRISYNPGGQRSFSEGKFPAVQA